MAALALVVVSSAVIAQGSAHAVLAAAWKLMAEGQPPGRIDAGIGWVGEHAHLPMASTKLGPTQRWSSYYASLFPASTPCLQLQVAYGAPRADQVRRVSGLPLLARPRSVVLNTLHGDGCSTPA